MNFNTLLLSTLCIVVLVGCKKDYTCECSVGSQTIDAVTTKLKKKEAQDWCNNLQSNTNGINITCKLVED